jgi:hypothetical protein
VQSDVSDVWPRPEFRVACDELQFLRNEAEIQRLLHGIDADAPLPRAARVAPRFRHLAPDSAYLKRRQRAP